MGALDRKEVEETPEVVEGETEKHEDADEVSEDEISAGAEDDFEDDDTVVDDDDDYDEPEEDVVAKAEKKRAGFQSKAAKEQKRADKLEAEKNALAQTNAQLIAQINQHAQNPNYQQPIAQENADVSDLLAIFDGDPEDMPSNAKVIKAIRELKRQNEVSGQQRMTQQQMVNFMQSQPDFREVNAYTTTHNLSADPYFMGASTDQTGAFFGVRAKIQADKIKTLELENENLKRLHKKKGKGKIPRTGNKGVPATKANQKKSRWG